MVHYLAATDAKLPLTIRSHTQLELCLGEESPRRSAIYKLVLEEVALFGETDVCSTLSKINVRLDCYECRNWGFHRAFDGRKAKQYGKNKWF